MKNQMEDMNMIKYYPWKFKLKWNGIEWGKSEKTLNSDNYFYYIYWFDFINNPENRKWGFDYTYYDGPHKMFCFWWFCVVWSTPYTKEML
jgi:hypothetical protein